MGRPNYNVGRNTQFLSEQKPGHSDQVPRSNISNFPYLYNHSREAKPFRVGYHGVVDQTHHTLQAQYPGGDQPYSRKGESRELETPFRQKVEAPRINWYKNSKEYPSPSYDEERRGRGRGRRRSRSHSSRRFPSHR